MKMQTDCGLHGSFTFEEVFVPITFKTMGGHKFSIIVRGEKLSVGIEKGLDRKGHKEVDWYTISSDGAMHGIV